MAYVERVNLAIDHVVIHLGLLCADGTAPRESGRADSASPDSPSSIVPARRTLAVRSRVAESLSPNRERKRPALSAGWPAPRWGLGFGFGRLFGFVISAPAVS